MHLHALCKFVTSLLLLHFDALCIVASCRSLSVASDLDGTKTDGPGADGSGPVMQGPSPLELLNAAIAKVDASIDKVDGKIDKAEAALEPGGGGAYLGMSGAELRDYLKELVIERKQLRAKEADLREELKALVAKRDRAALTATTGECGMSCANHFALQDLPPLHEREALLPFQRA
jgi:hypothetical protein